MRETAWESVVARVGDHPLIATWLLLIFAILLLLGSLHACRIFVRFLVVLADEVKHELAGLALWLRRLKETLTTWRAD
jgi:hypothetical protein